jgi:magnesium-transporting ATPase (P-type)
VYRGARDGRMEITVNGVLKTYVLHHTLEFDPTRKCMSVIVQNESGVCHVCVTLQHSVDSCVQLTVEEIRDAKVVCKHVINKRKTSYD